MTIDLIDAFGTKIGSAEIEFTGPVNPEQYGLEVAQCLHPVTSVQLPTLNSQVFWRLEVRV